MNHDNVWFATTNNGYPDCQRDRLEQGFNALFAPRILRKKAGFNGPWFANRGVRPPHLATCEQAEVLYPERVSLEHLKVVYVEKVDHHDAVVGWLDEFGYSNVRVVVGLQKFQGRQN